MMNNKPLTFGIMGGAIALAVVVGVLFVIPVVIAPAPTALQSQPQQQPQIQNDPERQQILDTPNTGQPGQPIIQHQELRAQDPVFDRYMLTVEKCFADIRAPPGSPGPDVPACTTAIADGVERWCGIDSEHYHAEKCKEANDNSEVFDISLRADAAVDRLLG